MHNNPESFLYSLKPYVELDYIYHCGEKVYNVTRNFAFFIPKWRGSAMSEVLDEAPSSVHNSAYGSCTSKYKEQPII